MNRLHRILTHPLTELVVGCVLLVAGMLEIRDIIAVKLPNKGPMLPHAVAFLGAAMILRSLPSMFLGLEIVRQALPAALHNQLGLEVDRLTHSHAVSLFMGLILIAAGAADLADMLAQGEPLKLLSSASGAIIFGLAPVINALLALYKGLSRVESEHPFRLLDRAVNTPWLQSGAGAAMLLCGLAEMWDGLHRPHALGNGPALQQSLAVLGLFALLSGLPGVFEGLRQLTARR